METDNPLRREIMGFGVACAQTQTLDTEHPAYLALDAATRALAERAEAAETLLRDIHESAMRFHPGRPPILSLKNFLAIESQLGIVREPLFPLAPAPGTETGGGER